MNKKVLNSHTCLPTTEPGGRLVNVTSTVPVSVSKLTVAWNLFPCFKMSSVSAMSGLSLISWILNNARSRFNQKLIS